jgi:hypothetical protein
MACGSPSIASGICIDPALPRIGTDFMTLRVVMRIVSPAGKAVESKPMSRHNTRKGGVMKSTEITLPELALIAGTRGMLGAGAALLVSSKLNNDQRKAVGWTLFLIGLISTIPLAIDVFSKRR